MDLPDRAAPSVAARLFGVAQVASAVLGADGAVTGWSEGAERLLGYPGGEVLDRPALSLLAAEDGADARPGADSGRRAVVERFRAGEAWSGRLALRHRDGRTVRLAVQLAPVHAREGAVPQWVALARDAPRTPDWELSRLMLEPMLEHSPVGVAVLDTDLRYVWVNDGLEYGGAVPRAQRVGLRLAEAFPHMTAELMEGPMLRVLETGEPVLDFELLGPSPVDPAARHAWWLCFFRLQDHDGRVLGVWYMVMDITERWRARQRLSLLNEASRRIGRSLDLGAATQELADVAVPRFADFAVVDVRESVLRGDEPEGGAPSPGDLTLRRTGRRSNLTPAGGPAPPTEELARLPSTAALRCLADGEVEYVGADSSEWGSPDSAWTRRARELGVHSAMTVPVRARGITLGVAHFARAQHPDPFDEVDVGLAGELAAQAAVSVDNARRFTREHRAALALQRSLLPRALGGGGGLDVAWRYLPADAPSGVGGDWFDVIPLSGARVAVVIGDIVGHGTHAAATMGRLRTAVRTLADLDLPPDEVLAHLDDLAVSLIEHEGAGAGAGETDVAAALTGATCLYAVYDPVAGTCAMARAGHPPPAVRTDQGAPFFADLPAGPPLGLGSLPFERAEVELPEGSLLAFYTDGLVRRRDADIDVGLERLREALARPDAGLEAICHEATRAVPAEQPQSDDVALIVARTRLLGADRVASWELSTDPAVVSEARELVNRQLTDWGLGGLAFTTELIASELVTNAIRYGEGPIALRLIRQSVLTCEVSDASPTAPRLRHARTTDEGGRGLSLVAQLSRRWGTRYTTEGKVIWADQDLRAPDGAPSPTLTAAF